MRNYSLTLIVNPDLKEAERKKLLDSVSSLIKEANNLQTEEWGQKPLTYPIKRQVAGYFAHFSFEAEGLPMDLEKRLLTADGVLRHLLLKVNPKAQKTEKKAEAKTSVPAKEEKKVVKKAEKKSAPKKAAKAKK